MSRVRHVAAGAAAMALLAAPVAAALVGLVGDDWRRESTGTGTTVTSVSASPAGVVEVRIANGETLGVETGGYEWRCVGEGAATITYSVYLWSVGREPTLQEPVTCVAVP